MQHIFYCHVGIFSLHPCFALKLARKQQRCTQLAGGIYLEQRVVLFLLCFDDIPRHDVNKYDMGVIVRPAAIEPRGKQG